MSILLEVTMKNETIALRAHNHIEEYNQMVDLIKEYQRIAVFAHARPDYDALGTQLGLTTWLRDNFPHKEIKAFGHNHVVFTPRLYPELDTADDSWFDQPFLAIVVDTSNADRVADQRFAKATFVIKFDHHPAVEQYGNLNIVDTKFAAASEFVANFIFTRDDSYIVSKQASIYLYSGIAGDSGRFQYSSTTAHTFSVAALLMEGGFDLTKDVYEKMYGGTLDDLYVLNFILNNFKVTDHGIAYYVLTDENLKTLNLSVERGKENVNVFAELDGINAWAAITEDVAAGVWRVSIRSKDVPINEVAKLYRGGGHKHASGATLNSYDELESLINALNGLFPKNK